MSDEKFAIAGVCSAVKFHKVIVVVSVESDFKFVEEEPLALLSVPERFLAFADHSIVHCSISFQGLKYEIKKHANTSRAFGWSFVASQTSARIGHLPRYPQYSRNQSASQHQKG
ncbi:MAG TPA: hypothetical protein PKK96_07875 [Anaerolineales bacterium]|nr:hypothetical protein [Anaerolineales bacterium]HMS00664.1 hypothetical protein [Anaerolineales bacterium]HNQ94873.1 hypothetical protein [Anaerolineales bacterium]HNS60907.1 hypothetical protein [Anaerolineales bacterium]